MQLSIWEIQSKAKKRYKFGFKCNVLKGPLNKYDKTALASYKIFLL